MPDLKCRLSRIQKRIAAIDEANREREEAGRREAEEWIKLTKKAREFWVEEGFGTFCSAADEINNELPSDSFRLRLENKIIGNLQGEIQAHQGAVSLDHGTLMMWSAHCGLQYNRSMCFIVRLTGDLKIIHTHGASSRVVTYKMSDIDRVTAQSVMITLVESVIFYIERLKAITRS